jgi:hypothetical protein
MSMPPQATARRALSTLATKLHPPMPLSPRESKQLLNLLTASFRAHLDREHPVTVPEGSANSQHARTQLVHMSQQARPQSSHTSAHHHIDAILSNPLLSRKPVRRGSESNAVEILRDPLNWFLDQIAIGAADISKATMCLEAIKNGRNPKRHLKKDERMPATVIAEWLRTSGLENSKQFLDMLNLSRYVPNKVINLLLPMLVLGERNTEPLWRWFTRSPALRMEETGLSEDRIHYFRLQLLKDMSSCAHTSSRDEALILFLRVFEMYRADENHVNVKMLQALGQTLVSRIEWNPKLSSSTDIYESFLYSCSSWLGIWHKAVQATLWLHHPTRPDPYPGLAFIIDPKGAQLHVNANMFRQQYLVRLCLGVAQQLLDRGQSVETQVAMNFAQTNFPDLVLSRQPVTNSNKTAVHRAKLESENYNLALLDRLLPT